MMRRGTSTALMTGLLIVLLFLVYIQVRVLPTAVEQVISTFPEVSNIAVPAIIWGVLAIACWQAVALIGLKIVALARKDKFGPPAYGWLRAIVGCLLAFIILGISAFIALNILGYGTPGVLLCLIGGDLIALIGASSLSLFLGTRPFRGHYAHA
ncbi:hypothetical protein ABIB48_000474 [Arthrobacter sp. UYCu511]|uniref:DUF2975 domain-containing protein n=1 Tax=Arthrobacter sp. UYCu511 TaxID=3156337 RepID=UPI0033964A7E